MPPPIAPIEEDSGNNKSFEVKKILKYKDNKQTSKRKYFVRQLRQSVDFNKQKQEEELEDALKLVARYKASRRRGLGDTVEVPPSRPSTKLAAKRRGRPPKKKRG